MHVYVYLCLELNWNLVCMFSILKNQVKSEANSKWAKTGVCIDTDTEHGQNLTVFSKFYIRTKYFGHLYRYRLFCIDTDGDFCPISPCFTVLVWNQPEPFPNIFIVSRDIVHDSKTLQTSFKEKKKIYTLNSGVRFISDHPKCDPMCVRNPDPSKPG